MITHYQKGSAEYSQTSEYSQFTHESRSSRAYLAQQRASSRGTSSSRGASHGREQQQQAGRQGMVEAGQRSRRGGGQGKQQGMAQLCHSAAVELEQGSGSDPMRPKTNPRHGVTALSSPTRARQVTTLFPVTAPARVAANSHPPCARARKKNDFGALPTRCFQRVRSCTCRVGPLRCQ
jgi:hypothetical protein